jgi:triacylglycerol esterase/lipase EstA (alpha/beta hydrolase family)
MRRLIVGIVAGLLVCVATTSAAAASLPVIYNSAYGFSHSSPTASPPGANDFACKPTAAHPRPVILVHGTFEDMANNWQALSPLLADNGYCVFALNYGSFVGSGLIGVYGTGYIENSATQLAAFVDKVLTATGATQVDIVGHSQGGMMPRYYMRFRNGAVKVHTLVRSGAVKPRHDTRRVVHAVRLLPGVQRGVGRLPSLRRTGGRLGVHEPPQRGRRHRGRSPLHGDRVRQR